MATVTNIRIPLSTNEAISLIARVAVTRESDVAEVVWRAANDTIGQLRFPAGADAVALGQSR